MAEKIDIEASKNEDHNKLALSDLNKRLHKIQDGCNQGIHLLSGQAGTLLLDQRWLHRTIAGIVVSLTILVHAYAQTKDYGEIQNKFLKESTLDDWDYRGKHYSPIMDSTLAYGKDGKPFFIHKKDTIIPIGIHAGEFAGFKGEWIRWNGAESEDDPYLFFYVPLAHLKDVEHLFDVEYKKELKETKFKKRLTLFYVIVGGVALWMLIIGSSGYGRRCIRCRKWWAREIIRTDDLGNFSETTTRNESRSVTSPMGRHVGDVWIPVTRTNWFKRYRETYQCKKCGHTWQSGELSRKL